MPKSSKSSIQIAKKVLRIEAQAISALIPRIGKSFERAVMMVEKCAGRVIVTGMGKAGLIGRKIAATLASTGTPSMFLHPAEAIHGDLGMVMKNDIVLAISNSGETEEIVKLVATIKKIGSPLIGMTGNARSNLARTSDVVLDIGIDREACPLNLAPTTSTTVTLALGDALAMALQERKGFKAEDFALFHPGGSLGRKLLRVKELMRGGKANPVVREEKSVKEALLVITRARAGSCTVVDKQGRLKGIFTDGDLRRHLEKGEMILHQAVGKVATPRPVFIMEEQLAVEAIRILREKKIDELPVVNAKGRVSGLLDVQDLLKAGFV